MIIICLKIHLVIMIVNYMYVLEIMYGQDTVHNLVILIKN